MISANSNLRCSQSSYSNTATNNADGTRSVAACVGNLHGRPTTRAPAVRLVRPAPRIPAVGETWNQWCLPLIGFEDPEHLRMLLRYVNNAALRRGADQIVAICERGDRLRLGMKGLQTLTIGGHLYVKPLQLVVLGNRPVQIPGIDL